MIGRESDSRLVNNDDKGICNKIIFFLVIVFIILLVILLCISFVRKNREKNSVSEGVLEEGNVIIILGAQNFSTHKVVRYFSVKNDGDTNSILKLNLEGLVDLDERDYSVYSLFFADTKDESYKEVISNNVINKEKLTLESVKIPANTTYYYKLIVS